MLLVLDPVPTLARDLRTLFSVLAQPLFAQQAPALYQLSLNKFFLDELYDVFVLKPLAGFTEFSRLFDQLVVDNLVDLVGHLPSLVGRLVRPIQNGLVQFYALAMMLGLTVFLLALIRAL